MTERLQRRMTAGWRKPEGAVIVDRTTMWGNPYRLAKKREWTYPPLTVVHTRHGHPSGPAFGGFTDELDATRFAVEMYSRSVFASLAREPSVREYFLGPLVGKDLMCWCPLLLPDGERAPCHADVLLKYAARYETEIAGRTG